MAALQALPFWQQCVVGWLGCGLINAVIIGMATAETKDLLAGIIAGPFFTAMIVGAFIRGLFA